jgi:2-polyprenyl-6-methoxyphenol hydroxylase-like FAD-dependent oxidoreductase
MSTTTNTPHVAIIGGGPGGFTLLATLHKRGIPATLYERDTSLDARLSHGGCLDLHWETGQKALRENGLGDAFDALARYEGDVRVVCEADGTELIRLGGLAGDKPLVREELKPEIERRHLVRLLVDAVPADAIKWGHAFVAACPAGDDGAHEVEFANGAKITCDVLVGADGGRSRVRALLSDVQPTYSGVTGAELYISAEVAAAPEFAETLARVGKGAFMSGRNGAWLNAQAQGEGRLRVYTWFRGPEDFKLPEDGREAVAMLRARYAAADWNPVLLALLDAVDPSQVWARPVYTLPIGNRWPHARGITLLGDAAHMTVQSGEGANLAMRDAFDLGVALADAAAAGSDAHALDAAVRGYEETMCARAEKAARFANGLHTQMFDEHAPQSLMKAFHAYKAKAEAKGQAAAQ